MNPFIKPFVVNDRATRFEYVIYGLITIAYYYASFQYNTWLSINAEDYNTNEIYKVLHLFDFIVFYIGLTTSFRRLHDLNKSKWFMLWSLTVIGIIPILYLLTFKKGASEDNIYGHAKESSTLEKPFIALYIVASIAFCINMWLEFRKVYDSMSEWQDTSYEVDKSTKIIERLYSDVPRHAAFRVLLICQGKEMGFLIYPMKKNSIDSKYPLIPFAINTETTTVTIHSSSDNLTKKFTISSDLKDKFITFDFLPVLDRQKIINEDIEIILKDYSSEYQVKFDMKGQKVASLIQSCN